MVIYTNVFPFASVSDDELLDNYDLNNIQRQQPCDIFDPFSIQDSNYNIDLDVNQFYIRSRNVNFPRSENIFLDNFPLRMQNSVISLLTFNIRSISSNFQYFVDTLLSYHMHIDVLGLTETRLDADISPLYKLPDYDMFTTNRNRYGGGVVIYISSKYKSSKMSEFSVLEPFLESLGIEAKFNGNTYLFICIYRPPQSSINNFCNILHEILHRSTGKNYCGVFIFGDFNLNLLQYNSDTVQDFINLMYSFSLYPLTTLPTRVTTTSSTLIDHIWSTQIETNIANYVIKTDITDHFPVMSVFKCDKQSLFHPTYTKKRFFYQESITKFCNILTSINWSDIITCTCANIAYNSFYSTFKTNYDICFPEKIIKLNRKKERSPHITEALKTSIKEKNRLEKLAHKWPLTYKDHYKKYRNKLNSLLKAAKSKYNQDKLISSQGNPKSHWKAINNILGRSSDMKNTTVELTPQCHDIPNKFNDHFLKAGVLNDDSIDEEFKKYLNNSPNFSLYLTPVTQSEVEKYLQSLKTTASGCDEISPTILKRTANLISGPLTNIINLTLKTGIFPSELKKAKVIPLLKSGNRKDINNYRPISILPAFSKIFEKAISTRLVHFIETNNLFSDSQHGFRSGRSTESAITQFISNVYYYLEKKHYVAGVFLDLSKAFDSLCHCILSKKLSNFGVRGIPLKLFELYYK